MTGWNMPPGCNVSDIPGNRPEDEAAEALYDKIYAIFDKSREEQMTEEQRAELIFKLCGEVYHEGYQQGQADAEMARDYQEAAERSRTPDGSISASRYIAECDAADRKRQK